jgi:hypothetical protein
MHIHMAHLPHLLLLARVVMCAAIFTLTVACGPKPSSPVSPDPSAAPEAGAAPDGSTLKSATPAPVSPISGAQVTDPILLTASKATGKFMDIALSYRFQVRSASTVVYDSGAIGGVGAGTSVTHAPTAQLEPDTTFTWRVRAEYQGAFGSWSSDAAFKSPVGAYIRGSEIRDPLTIGRTVGTIAGPTQFVAGKGLELLAHTSHVRYQLQQTLQAGEFSMMVTGIDEGSPGDKSKVMSMQEGDGDITTNRYRFTAEKRGRSYVDPGAVTFRIITGDPDHANGKVNDGNRVVVPMNDEAWYFWKITWGGNRAALEVRADSPEGRTIYSSAVGMGGSPYRPSPHVLFLGQPFGRAGEIDASIPGMIVKNVWVSAAPRPVFPQ